MSTVGCGRHVRNDTTGAAATSPGPVDARPVRIDDGGRDGGAAVEALAQPEREAAPERTRYLRMAAFVVRCSHALIAAFGNTATQTTSESKQRIRPRRIRTASVGRRDRATPQKGTSRAAVGSSGERRARSDVL
jgi:hypothetical protein